ncbi:head-tail adaptor protein [Leeuwenhoekiella sp. LLG6367-2.1]|uniref:phage head completion protein n=1 Tax=Leeuwenhoekiella sp. LLG6367-2.1 TaxID=3160833 RepID=UPI00386578E5
MASNTNFPATGELRTPISFFEVAGGRNSIKEQVDVFTPLVTLYAKRDDVSGSEALQDGTVIALQVRRYYIRFRQDLYVKGTKKMIIEDNGIKWNIHYMGVLGDNQFIELKCGKRE